MLGGAVAPGTLLLMHSLFGWRGAFMGAAVLGFVVAVVLLLQRDEAPEQPVRSRATTRPRRPSWRLLLSAPILINFVFFMLLSLRPTSACMNFSVVALGALYGTLRRSPPTPRCPATLRWARSACWSAAGSPRAPSGIAWSPRLGMLMTALAAS